MHCYDGNGQLWCAQVDWTLPGRCCLHVRSFTSTGWTGETNVYVAERGFLGARTGRLEIESNVSWLCVDLRCIENAYIENILSYRVAAMDHGLFSFVDVPHRQWPVILVTNPKHALFHLPGKENPNLQIGKKCVQ